MNSRDLHQHMWAQALDLLDRADKMHRQFFQPDRQKTGRPGWAPPVDIFETDRELLVVVALPGVAAGDVQVAFDGVTLAVVAERPLPVAGHGAIRRLEIPHGRFERRIDLNGLAVELLRQEITNGCLVLLFGKRGFQGA
ncbi:MAG TPA: Hsp20/alpha crystallin family protein [Burkholderiales bacterium]|nr:Hsp20/alpha crystallin family protein [Burkholderiales bacterium]